MAFESKWNTITPNKREEIIRYAKETTPQTAAKKYALECGMSVAGLAIKLRDLLKPVEIKKVDYQEQSGSKEKKPRNWEEEAKVKAQSRKKAFESVRLTPKEKKLIKDISDGKVDLETASRVIAAKAFEKLLKNPESASFNSFIQAEMLKLKRQEIEQKNNWAMELLDRMFAGQLPPTECPHCGHVLYKPLESHGAKKGVIIDAEPLSLTGNN